MNKFIARSIAVAAFAAASFASVSYASEGNVYRAHGTVVAVSAEKVTLKQDAVSELGWPARQVTYTADGRTVLNNIQVGQTVDANFTAANPYQASVHFVTPVSQ